MFTWKSARSTYTSAGCVKHSRNSGTIVLSKRCAAPGTVSPRELFKFALARPALKEVPTSHATCYSGMVVRCGEAARNDCSRARNRLDAQQCLGGSGLGSDISSRLAVGEPLPTRVVAAAPQLR